MGIWYPQCRARLNAVFDPFQGPDGAPVFLADVLPKAASVHCNGYKEADTWELVFDAKKFPFQPEQIRAFGVEIYMFSTAGLGENPEVYISDAYRLVAGLADNVKLQLSADGREFRCDGRDYTALLIDRQWDPRIKIPVGYDLKTTVKTIVDQAITTTKYGQLSVLWESEADIPIVGKVGANVGKKRVQSGTAPKATGTGTSKTGITVKAEQSVWDTIYKLCLSYGFIVFVRGTDVVIADPQSQTALNQNAWRRMAWGHNLSSLEMDRKLGKERVPQIKVRSYDPKTRKVNEGVYPKTAKEVTTGIGTKRDEVQTYVVSEARTVADLEQIAKTRYNNLARSEGTIRWKTRDLRSLDSSITWDNLLQLRAGDPVVIAYDPYNDEEMRKLDADGRFEVLMREGFDRNVALTVAWNYDRIRMVDRPFYCKEVNFTWDFREGITIDAECINYISIDRDDPAARSVGSPAKSPTTSADKRPRK